MRRLPVLAFLLAVLFPFASLAADKTSDAEAVIRAIYAQYSKDGWPEDAEKKNFSPDLWAKWDEVQQAADANNEVGVDFDVFLNAQDTDTVTNLTTRFTPEAADRGKVEATFTAFDAQTTVTYEMVKTADGWKIDNISWDPDEDDLRKTLAAIREQQKNGGGDGGDDGAEDAD
jgi:hypothetical protein